MFSDIFIFVKIFEITIFAVILNIMATFWKDPISRTETVPEILTKCLVQPHYEAQMVEMVWHVERKEESDWVKARRDWCREDVKEYIGDGT